MKVGDIIEISEDYNNWRITDVKQITDTARGIGEYTYNMFTVVNTNNPWRSIEIPEFFVNIVRDDSID
jgi:hypothetical protein